MRSQNRPWRRAWVFLRSPEAGPKAPAASVSAGVGEADAGRSRHAPWRLPPPRHAACRGLKSGETVPLPHPTSQKSRTGLGSAHPSMPKRYGRLRAGRGETPRLRRIPRDLSSRRCAGEPNTAASAMAARASPEGRRTGVARPESRPALCGLSLPVHVVFSVSTMGLTCTGVQAEGNGKASAGGSSARPRLQGGAGAPGSLGVTGAEIQSVRGADGRNDPAGGSSRSLRDGSPKGKKLRFISGRRPVRGTPGDSSPLIRYCHPSEMATAVMTAAVRTAAMDAGLCRLDRCSPPELQFSQTA